MLIKLAYVENHAGSQAVLLVLRHDGVRTLLLRTIPLGPLRLDFCKIPRLRVVR